MELKRTIDNIYEKSICIGNNYNNEYNNEYNNQDTYGYKKLLKLYQHYDNPANCDKITLCNNHIYFNATINLYNIQILIDFINSIIDSFQNVLKHFEENIYIHITTKGGTLYSLRYFIEFLKTNDVELISIIEKECNDVGIILASLCNYRIIHKKALCNLSKYNSDCTHLYYWGYFKQCENSYENIEQFYNELTHIFCNIINSKITNEKFKKYLENNSIWDSKKYKKLGLADEIV